MDEVAQVDALVDHTVPVIFIGSAERGGKFEAFAVDLGFIDDAARSSDSVGQQEIGDFGEDVGGCTLTVSDASA